MNELYDVDKYEPMTERERVEPGDRVLSINVPGHSRIVTSEKPKQKLGRVSDVVEETTYTGVNSKIEQELAVVETDDGQESRVSLGNVNRKLTGGDGGATLIPLGERSDSDGPGGFGGGGSFRGPSTPTDIGRTGTGRFDRPDSEPGVDPEPIARNNQTGRFGLDPFDIGSFTIGTSSNELFGEFGDGGWGDDD